MTFAVFSILRPKRLSKSKVLMCVTRVSLCKAPASILLLNLLRKEEQLFTENVWSRLCATQSSEPITLRR